MSTQLIQPAPLCLNEWLLCHKCRGAGRLPVAAWRSKEIECYECSGTGLHLPYQVAWGWCNENTRRFLTFAEALAFRDARGDGDICNLDGVDVDDDCDETGHYGTTDGLTDEERERAL